MHLCTQDVVLVLLIMNETSSETIGQPLFPDPEYFFPIKKK
jgi:hypothetical protein